MSLEAQSELVKEGEDHLSELIFTKDSMDADKPVPVVKNPPVRFIVIPTNQGITGNIAGYWHPEIFVAVITMVDVPVEEALDDILMNSIKVVIHLECDEKLSWMRSQG